MPKKNQDHLYLAKLQDYYARWKSLPSYGKVGELLGIASLSAVSKILFRLNSRGFIERTPDDQWVPTLRFFERPREGVIPAGLPTEVLDLNEELCLIDTLIVDKPSVTSLILVKGDSMIDAGICDGDYAVVERRGNAKKGEIVAALVDGEVTLKYLKFNKGVPELHPANNAFKTIYPKERFEVFGVMIGLVRKFKR